MINFWTLENIVKYRDPYNQNSNYNGYWTDRNGEKAIVMAPVPFWHSKNVDPDGVEKFSKILFDELDATKTYLFDFWIDTDAVVSGGANRNGGLRLRNGDTYVDNNTFAPVSSGSDGWIHRRKIVTGVNNAGVYYYTNMPVYYRWDSFIVEYSETEFRKTGTVASFLVENREEISPIQGGATYCNEIMEW